MPSAALLLAAMICGCKAPSPQVVVYAALDREFSEPSLNDFANSSGVQVLAKYDDESTKTVGLTNIIIQESSRPRCDVFWNNEILNTLRLEQKGLLDVYRSPAAKAFPEMWRSPNGTWHGFAARARVILANTQRLEADSRPNSVLELANDRWRGQAGLAKPLFGTTATHAAVLFAVWGPQRAQQFFAAAKANMRIMAGNKHVAQAVGVGEADLGFADQLIAVHQRASFRSLAKRPRLITTCRTEPSPSLRPRLCTSARQ